MISIASAIGFLCCGWWILERPRPNSRPAMRSRRELADPVLGRTQKQPGRRDGTFPLYGMVTGEPPEMSGYTRVWPGIWDPDPPAFKWRERSGNPELSEPGSCLAICLRRDCPSRLQV